MKKLWGGRFSQETAEIADLYTQSISYDSRLWQYDIIGSIAHTKMLLKQGIISSNDAELILKGLDEIYNDIKKGEFVFSQELEDIHMNIESALINKIGDAGAKLHTARSRNDQIALDLRLFLREETTLIINLIKRFQSELVKIAEEHLETIMPGYTHTQRAQPVLLSHHLLAYYQMFQRDIERFSDSLNRINIMPLGSCALAGSTLNIDRHYTAELLGFDRVSLNSMDSVSDRDFIIEFLAHSSILIMHISRLAEELVLWSTTEFSFIEISDTFTTGSSIMPQKKNPDVAEIMRGKTGRIYGNLISLLTMMKGLPLTYNRDMQEDKEPLFDTVDTVKLTLQCLIEMFPQVKFNKDKMLQTSSEGFANATDMAEYLVGKGIPFRKAHEIIGNIVKYCLANKIELHDLTIGQLKTFSELFSDDIYDWLTPSKSINKRQSYGSASLKSVLEQLQEIQKK